jgi:methylmalonyl-CoA mutase N-terminal domain/subunit
MFSMMTIILGRTEAEAKELQVEREQVESLRRIKQQRSADDVRRTRDELKRAAEANRNVMPPLLEAVRARTTVGEAMNAMAEAFGRYHPGAAW